MNQSSTDDDKGLVTNERSPKKRRKRKSRKKKAEHPTSFKSSPSQYIAIDDNFHSDKSNDETNDRHMPKHESFYNRDNNDIGHASLDQCPPPAYSKADPLCRSGPQHTSKEEIPPKHSRKGNSIRETSFTDPKVKQKEVLDLKYGDNPRTFGLYNDMFAPAENQKLPSRDVTNNSLLSESEKSADSGHRNYQKPVKGERGRPLEKHPRSKLSNSNDFLDSESKRDSFSAFIDLSKNPHFHQSFHYSGDSDTTNQTFIDKRHNKPCHTDLNLKTEKENNDQKSTANLLKNPTKLTVHPERTMEYIDYDESAAQMEKNIDPNIKSSDVSTRGLRDDKRLDRRSYKSPRRFSGRSVSRERRKRGKSPDTTDKTTTAQCPETTNKASNTHEKEITTDGKKEERENIEDDKIEKTVKSESILSRLMSRSIQTSMQLLEIDKDQNEGKSLCKTETSSPVVPLIVEHTSENEKQQTIHISTSSGEKRTGDESISRNSSESEVFKTPLQSPLLERKALAGSTKENKQEKQAQKDKQKDADKKSTKLSFLAVVALKRKLARQRKKKNQKEDDDDIKTDKKGKSFKSGKSKAGSPEDSNIPDEKNEQYSSKFYIENETNLNVGNLSYLPETDILDVDEIKTELPKKDKKISFDIISEPVASDEPLDDAYIHRQITKRRQSEVFREKRAKAISYCKKFVAFLFSHIGLCSLMVAYAILGGFVFRAIEGPFEMETKIKVISERGKTRDEIMKLATELVLNKRNKQNITLEIDDLLLKFQTLVYIATDIHGFNNEMSDKSIEEQTNEQWSLASSLLFAITIMTTIGYGHVAPKTDTGRIVTIGYAVLGIPLTLLCLTNIGDLMATGFRMLYARVCCGVCCLLFTPQRKRIPDPEKASGSIEYKEGRSTDKSPEVINVPTSVCILLMTSYILLGTLLFSIWEGWDAITGTYFSFITLSTIGLGDVVPGTAMNQWDDEEKLVLCAMYLVFGLSLIAMCFNLVQEDVKAKCRWLGSKIGIIDNSK